MIERDLTAAAGRTYDLLVVGGGVYGACTAMEAAARGLHVLLIERDDFAGATSAASLRIVHGGLRYLQSLDLPRCVESIGERSWFLREFPEHVRPLACVMPLDGRGLRRPRLMRAAWRVNELLSRHRNQGLSSERCLPEGRIIGSDEAHRLLGPLAGQGCRGAAIWHDALLARPQRVHMELLRRAVMWGAVCLNYVAAEELLASRGRVHGIQAVDRCTGASIEFQAERVINCAGPWSRELAARWDCEVPHLFRPSVAFNLSLDRPVHDMAVALKGPRPDARTLFLVPWRGGTLAGTCHLPWSGPVTRPLVDEAQIIEFVKALNEAVPGLDASRGDVRAVYAGFLPARSDGSDRQASQAVFCDHGAAGGPRGLYSVSGVKLTTARLVAARALRRIYGPARGVSRQCPPSAHWPDADELSIAEPGQAAGLVGQLGQMVREEAVVHLDDLVFRRGDYFEEPAALRLITGAVEEIFSWDAARQDRELAKLQAALESMHMQVELPGRTSREGAGGTGAGTGAGGTAAPQKTTRTGAGETASPRETTRTRVGETAAPEEAVVPQHGDRRPTRLNAEVS